MKTVQVTVIAVLPDFEQAAVQAEEGFMWAITTQTPGYTWRDVTEGDRLECVVDRGRLLAVKGRLAKQAKTECCGYEAHAECRNGGVRCKGVR